MRHKLLLFGVALFMLFNGAMAQSTIIRGLTVIVEFAERPFVESDDSVALMMNQTDFSGWGNEGSVKDFFLTQSNGKVLITSEVIRVSLPYTRDVYYGDNATRKDISDIVDAINAKYPAGFQNLSLKPDNSLVHFHLLTKVGGGAWAFGPQPGSNTIKNNGQNVFVYTGNITNYDANDQPEYNTICHEMGHNVMEWPDHYQTGWSNLGNYAVMASAGNRKQPQMINPALRLQKGWIDNVVEIGNVPFDQTFTATSNSYSTVYKYTNPLNSKEYLLLYPHTYGKYFQQYLNPTAVADQGLAIYYVDEDEGMEKPNSDPDYQIKLITADNLDELHDEDLRFALNKDDIRGDFNDLYDNVNNSFPAGTPFRWKGGGEFGLNLGDISAPGASMSFTVYARYYTHLATSDKNGDISPKGVLTGTNPITYTFTPNPGYEINSVKVNGVNTAVTNNTLTVASGNKTVEVSYKRKATQVLPAPWQSVNVGSQTPAGFATIEGDKFVLESNSGDIWGGSDNFSYIYQPISGDVTVVAKLTSLSRINNWSKAGIMIRESLNPNAAYSMLMKTPRNYARVQQRASTGANATDNPNGIKDLHYYNLYNWIKVERKGDVITSFVSRDQVTWTKLGEQTIVMGTDVFVGLALSGQNESEATKAIFENVSVILPNVKPTISFVSPVEGSSFHTIPDSLTITVNASDSDGSITKVEFYDSFHGLIGVDYTAPYSMNIGFEEAGYYYILALATDNSGASTSALTSVAINEWPINQKPVVTIASPTANQSFLAPATISINANASDPDGTVSKVEFFIGSNLVATDYSAPYNFVWNNVSAGTYDIIVKVTDNLGDFDFAILSGVVVSTSTADIIGAVCGTNNATLVYEVAPSKRVNATSFNWWYTGSSQSIFPVSGAAHKANLSTGNYFSAGQVCVGVNYSSAPWYANYCVNVAKCSSAREGEFETETNSVSYPNPFETETIIQIPVTNSVAEVQVFDANGVLVLSEQSTGEFRFGNDLNAGVYLVKITYDGKSETMKVVKQ